MRPRSSGTPTAICRTGTDLVVLPGGFSYGDYLRCGAIAARSPIMRAVGTACGARRTGARHLQRLPDSLRGGPPARRSDAQRRTAFRLQDAASAGRERSTRVHPTLRARPGRQVRHRPRRGQFRGRRRNDPRRSKATGRSRFAIATPTGRVDEASNPNGSENGIAGVFNERFNVLGLMPHPENLIDPLVGGVDGRPLFEALAA